MMTKTSPRIPIVMALVGLAVAVIAVTRISGQATPPATVTAFEGARVIVGDGRPPIENATVVVSGTKIAQVGRAGVVRVPADAVHINLQGKTVMPAIVDTHTHLSQTREALTDDLRRRAYYGIGAALSLGMDEGDLAFDMRANPLPDAARLFTAGRGITAPEPGRTTVPHWVTTEAEARDAVRQEAAHKVDIIKIWVDDRNGQYKKLSPELYRAVIDEAHKRGLRVIAHEYYLSDAKDLLRAGIDAFAHSVRDRDIDAEGLALFKQHPNVVLIPNLPDRGTPYDLDWLRESIPATDFQKLEAANTSKADAQTFFGIQARNLAKLNAAGVRITLGTDGNTPWGPHTEIEDMVVAGMKPMQAIVAATRNGAQFLRLDSGTIEAGRSADFLVLNANPLDDITNTRKIAAVYLRGAMVDRSPFRVDQTTRASR